MTFKFDLDLAFHIMKIKKISHLLLKRFATRLEKMAERQKSIDFVHSSLYPVAVAELK